MNINGLEIERKFLVASLPAEIKELIDDGGALVVNIEQHYVMAEGQSVVRIRRITGSKTRYVMTFKTGSGLVRDEKEIDITKEQYETLAEMSLASIRKTRCFLTHLGKHKIELDFFKDELRWLKIAEVEFDSAEEAAQFVKPDWFIEEVTDDPEFSNYSLALKSRHKLPKNALVFDLKKGLAEAIVEVNKKREGTDNVVILVAGGSASGKTSQVAKKLYDFFAPDSVLLSADNYFFGLRFMEEQAAQGRKLNWDHPDAVDLDGLKKDILLLKSGRPILERRYDFKTATAYTADNEIEPRKVIIVEGLFTLSAQVITKDAYKIYVDIGRHGRFLRRLFRDIKRTSQSPEDIMRYFVEEVEPNHYEYVESTKTNADLIIMNEFDPHREANNAGPNDKQLKFRLSRDASSIDRLATQGVISIKERQHDEMDEYYVPAGSPDEKHTQLIRIRNTCGMYVGVYDQAKFAYKGPIETKQGLLERARLEFEIDQKAAEYILRQLDFKLWQTIFKMRSVFDWEGMEITLDFRVVRKIPGEPQEDLGNFIEFRLKEPSDIEKVKAFLHLIHESGDLIKEPYVNIAKP